MKYFVASRWRNKSRVEEIVANLRGKGHEVFSFLESKNNFLSGSSPAEQMREFEAILNWKTDARIRAIFEEEIDALRKSDVVVLLLPAGSSAHIEAGIAYGWGKKLALIGEVEKAETHYLIFDEFHDSVGTFLNSAE